jgi:hypothetical protein
MDTASIFSALNHNPELKDLSYIAFQRLLHCASALKDDILQPQPHTAPVTAALDVLPPIITEFLSDSFHITLDAVDQLWDAVKDIVWALPTEVEEREAIEAMFLLHGKDRGLGTFYIKLHVSMSDIMYSCPCLIPSQQGMHQSTLQCSAVQLSAQEGGATAHSCFHSSGGYAVRVVSSSQMPM